MKAMVVRELGAGWVEEDIQIADPIDQEVRIEVKASGLCGSDHMEMSLAVNYPPPAVLGHEVAGVVTSIGPNVTEFAVGDHVAACLVQFCGKCEQCLDGEPGLCRSPELTVRGADDAPRLTDAEGQPLTQGMALGGFAQEALIHENMLVKLPDDMPFAQAAVLGCGVITGTGAVLNAAKVRPGEDVVIIGAGGVGLNVVSGAKLASAGKIISIDVNQESLDAAQAFGATHTINSAETDPVAAVQELTGGYGVRTVFDVVGIGATAQQGYDMLDRGGTLYQIGMGSPTDTLDTVPMHNAFGRKAVQGVFMGSGVPKRDMAMLVEQYQAGRLNLDDLVSAEIKLSEVNQGYEMIRDPKVNRVVITDFS
ncbi:Zn-dependent alcohol dehydrogenase [Enteractinococcus coprophilus]|uniref:S-(Hydroxymethyl)glutathione dehydrogenase/alcohol dehydrogenase n=1 Tax=Enteractinococcus coprophilus TaxID=1027633 RepID=A0A543AG56_9MICC|nr:Zn-dependent alcohol dehydrogenase [Enteractinococcus coprophilus]TQL71552.1 S-(hydroxymethyl)glutathione dehydrogenase/alcohol dehydrogenase [Enteractinococcus coprophilus]